MYSIIKHLHITLALISICGFIIRGGLKISGSRLMNKKWIKIIPHIVDTALLSCGVFMAVTLGLTLSNAPWLMAKMIALLAYISFGMITLRFAKTNQLRSISYGLAIACFGYMLLVAKTRMVIPF
jgi:uncharacterized membrane protein SirB2